jgi:hypothetical protein
MLSLQWVAKSARILSGLRNENSFLAFVPDNGQTSAKKYLSAA